jgi:hypothetical protein
VSTVLIVAGTVLLLLGVALIPVPGPGALVLVLGVVLLGAGMVARVTSRANASPTH